MKNKKGNYISARESSRISKSNRKLTKKYEAMRKRRNVPAWEYTSKMRDENNVVEFDDLHTCFFTDIGTVKAVDGVTFDVPRGKTVGIVGESGCGKSITSLSLMQLLQRPSGQITAGAIRFNGANGVYDIAKTPEREMRKLRGSQIAMIFQEPMTSLNPVFRIGQQVDEVIRLHMKDLIKQGILSAQEMTGRRSRKEAVRARTLEMLETVGIADSEDVYRRFPHQLSGGMRQRVMIAMALACSPGLIIADEPTTALDVTIQAQILDLLRDLKDRINSGIMLITHDLGVIAETADYVVVMYAGKVVEKGTVHEIFSNPAHPYTIGLMKSKPVAGKKTERLYSIPGQVPNPVAMPDCCYFRERCDMCIGDCGGKYPPEISLSPTHKVSCLGYSRNGGDENGK